MQRPEEEEEEGPPLGSGPKGTAGNGVEGREIRRALGTRAVSLAAEVQEAAVGARDRMVFVLNCNSGKGPGNVRQII